MSKRDWVHEFTDSSPEGLAAVTSGIKLQRFVHIDPKHLRGSIFDMAGP
jgi:hypothetical protein